MQYEEKDAPFYLFLIFQISIKTLCNLYAVMLSFLVYLHCRAVEKTDNNFFFFQNVQGYQNRASACYPEF